MSTDSPVGKMPSRWELFAFPLNGCLQIQTGPAWVVQRAPDSPLTFQFRQKPGGRARLLLSLLPLERAIREPAEILGFLNQCFEAFRGQAVESEIRPHAISTRDSSGMYFTITDRAPKPDEFLYQTTGIVPFGTFLLSFTILTNPGEALVFARALASIGSVLLRTDGSQMVEAIQPPAGLDSTMRAFLQISSNSEASLFVQEHPELLEPPTRDQCGKLAAAAREIGDHTAAINQATARYVLGLASDMGLKCSTLAPAEIRASLPEVLTLIVAIDALHGPDAVRRFIALLETILESPAKAHRGWASLHLWLANQLLALGSDLTPSVEKARLHFAIALKCYALESDIFVRAAISLQLSSIYTNLMTGERAVNVELAIDCAKSALASLNESGFIEDWVLAKNRLAVAYVTRVRGYKQANKECAIEALNDALAFSSAGTSQMWGSIQNNLGCAYLSRESGDQCEDGQKAIQHLKLALTVKAAGSLDWARTQLNLGNAYMLLSAVDIESNVLARDCYLTAKSLG